MKCKTIGAPTTLMFKTRTGAGILKGAPTTLLKRPGLARPSEKVPRGTYSVKTRSHPPGGHKSLQPFDPTVCPRSFMLSLMRFARSVPWR